LASSNATLAVFTPNETEVPNGGQVALVKRAMGIGQQGIAALQFQGQDTGHQQSSTALWDGVLPRGATGYTATTGVKALVTWAGPKQSQAVVWAASFQLDGATDLPAPSAENFPATGSANEVSATGNCNVVTASGMVQTLLTIPIAKIQNGQATAPTVGDHFRFRLRRAVENAADTLTDYAYVYSVELYDY
jgi:hypothetical protein